MSTLIQAPVNRNRRWHFAFLAIYCSRALLSPVVNKATKKKVNGRSVSYVALHIAPEAGPFGIDQTSLSQLVKEENVQKLEDYGGVTGLVAALRSDVKKGIRGDDEDIFNRKKSFGSNIYEKPYTKSFFRFQLKAMKDPLVILLILCAAFSLGFGIKRNGLKEGWSNGGSIFLTISLVTTACSASNCWADRYFNMLSNSNDNVGVNVVRDGWCQKIPIDDLLVGEVVSLRTGGKVPADGLLLDEYRSLQVDKSNQYCSLQVDKSNLVDCKDHVNLISTQNRFLHSGSMVIKGSACMLVTAVGMNTTWAEILAKKWKDSQKSTPLQTQLNKVATVIGKVGLSISFLVFAVCLIRYFVGRRNGNFWGKPKFGVISDIVGIIATSVAIASGSFVDGLPLAVAIMLAYSMKSIINNHAFVRKRSALEAIASANTIFTKLDHMTVVRIWLGQEFIEQETSSFVVPTVIELLQQAIGLSISQSPSKEIRMDVKEVKNGCNILYTEAFDRMKRYGLLCMKMKSDNTMHIHLKGTSRAVLSRCSHYYSTAGRVIKIDHIAREKMKQVIQDMESDELRCVAFAHKQIYAEPPYQCGVFQEQVKEKRMILLGFVGVKDPCKPGFRKAVEEFQQAGVNIKIVTRDSTSTARAIATECGILKPDQNLEGEVVEGLEFQNYTHEEKMERVDKIRVMARATAHQRLLMVEYLQKKDHVVAVVGDAPEDSAALRKADVGISMGSQATDAAKESSDIVIPNDDFISVVHVLKWGRTMFNHLQTFTQFQITVSITSLVIDLVTAVSAQKPPTINIVATISSGEIPFAAVQLLWVKLVMGTLAALALTLGQPAKKFKRRPIKRDFLITNVMWRNILSQSMYHIAVLLTLQFKGKAIFGVDDQVKDTLIFNTFVLCQIFNKFNVRELKKKNIFKRIHRSKLFVSIVGLVIVLQVIMVEFLKKFAGTKRLNWVQWDASIGLAAISWPLAWCVKWIPVPDKPFLSYLK
ncbi:hypothetical protein K2173_015690 [Erythroxylum novogranatense]|uniref:Calcium-transporting ATPase n=1 Tax=Erythroxylum novogranatense TaxID=1862640 RepID=A0AAV8THZ7_9ROSI|nr:hypothetical protein K2173_015690 [Erythroxylum novogranatense]